MEAENYLASGYGVRQSIEARGSGFKRLQDIASVWQPSRLKGIQVAPEYGTPFLAATQVFDLRPAPRKFLSLNRTSDAAGRFVENGTILVTCSGSVGRAILSYGPHDGVLISHDLLRVSPENPKHRGWIYGYLRAGQTHAMMTAVKYGHIIKHLEISHLNALPIPEIADQKLDKFNSWLDQIQERRNTAHTILLQAEALYAATIGPVRTSQSISGFSAPASELFAKRRRLDAGHHSPSASAILRRFKKQGLTVAPLSEVTERVWWITRFKRIFGDEGVPYMSADELFSVNPPITKRVLLEQTENPDQFFAQPGWIMMARSGQVYGLNGSVALVAEQQQRAFLSDDLLRIIPRTDLIRPGYLYVALGHPDIGRPLVIRHAYGTSIPHLDPVDVETIPIPRLAPDVEKEIADLAEKAVELRAEADRIENEMAREADVILDDFAQGKSS